MATPIDRKEYRRLVKRNKQLEKLVTWVLSETTKMLATLDEEHAKMLADVEAMTGEKEAPKPIKKRRVKKA